MIGAGAIAIFTTRSVVLPVWVRCPVQGGAPTRLTPGDLEQLGVPVRPGGGRRPVDLALSAAAAGHFERGHGRRETRSVRTLTVTGLGLDFPHVVQAVKILRHRTEARTGRVTRQTVYAITDMTAREASPQLIGRLARSQWGIEAVHHVRDTTFAEDASKIPTGHGPENMATLRNLAINTLRDAGCRSIAAGLREVSYTPFTCPLELLGPP
ncbi:hypothetical protein ACK389_35950 [Streptomyces antibioticus]|uniref:hypothetical protein n=1 Tax=Streptomyces antibioticus TaxID=1890 RepID=UPI000B181D38|nr:hypothetical protein [Streptomyces antibioticus]MCX5166435.1 hypothetical protein [Streptomyces antibioticus]MCX5173728.1 hypothetical protein [Streptomyces antibioticus]